MSTLQIMEGGIIPVEISDIHEVELQEFLGGGAFGTVWKVVDTSSGTPYTLKIIQGLRPGSVEVERVRLEAGVSIPSEYIVRPVGLREWNPSICLILFEHFPGKSLDKLIEDRSLTSEQKRSIFKQTLIGVSDAHRSNVVHRDLKPGNILVGSDDHVMLIDFGISKFKGSGLTVTGDIIGTPPYMAPELIIASAKRADARSDVFSLGAILYELSMGHNFWQHKGWTELKDLIGFLTRTPPPEAVVELDAFSCDFYPSAGEAVLRMMTIAPEKRHESVDAVLSALGYLPFLPEPPKDLHLKSPILIVESGLVKGARTVLGLADGERRTVGRDADIVLPYDSISRKHLEIKREGDAYLVRELGSKNGTMIRGIELTPDRDPMELRHGDRIKIGDIFLRFAFLREL